MKVIRLFQVTDVTVAEEVKASLQRHLWNLCESLIVLSWFDKHLDVAERAHIAETLVNTPNLAVFQ